MTTHDEGVGEIKQLKREFNQVFLPAYYALGSEAGWVVGEKLWSFVLSLKARWQEEVVDILRKAEITCSGSCGAGCEYAVRDLINALTTPFVEGEKEVK